MAVLYGSSNKLISEIAVCLMNNQDFAKFVYYIEEKDDGEDILTLPDIENPVEVLAKKQVHANRRVPKVLHEKDVNVFINFADSRNYGGNSTTVKTIALKISILVHNDCLYTANGKRDVILVDCISDILESREMISGIGKCTVSSVKALYGLHVEYNGFEISCKVDVFK